MSVRIPKVLPRTPAWADTFGVDGHGIFAGFNVNGASQLLRWIEPGEFEMGSPHDELGRYSDEGPQHEVTIANGFWLGQTPVTQSFWEAVTGDNPSHFKGNGQRPVESVSWEDATRFCSRLTDRLAELDEIVIRLPTEAEWEYACRAGTKTALYSNQPLTSADGVCPNLDELAWYDENSGNTTHPVAEKMPNAWGLYDMLGNVWEWCEDTWHDDYTDAPADGSAWCDEGGGRVYRGGGWARNARDCRCACRDFWLPDARYPYVGFRLVLSRSSTGSFGRSS